MNSQDRDRRIVDELVEARETIRRLNRRCQQAEVAIKSANECIAHLSKGNPWCGGNLGRGLLAYHAGVTNEILDRVKKLQGTVCPSCWQRIAECVEKADPSNRDPEKN